MDNLYLSYKEVSEEIPYLLLLLMSADKPRPVYGDLEEVQVKQVSGREMMKQKEG